MTINARFKSDVRLFSGLNNLSYTSGLREFDTLTGDPLYRGIAIAPGPDDIAEQAWAEERNLRPGRRDKCFHELSNDSGQIGKRFESHWDNECSSVGRDRFKDHPRSYLFRGPNDKRARTAVLTFSPYQNWDNEFLIEELQGKAAKYDVRFRIGMPRDVTYGAGTVPIVFWNPRVINLG